jgi:hypothetical protein
MAGGASVPGEEVITRASLEEKLSGFSALVRTRSAVRSGEALHRLDATERRTRDVLGPWAFKIRQSSVSVAVALALLRFFSWIAEEPGTGALVSAEVLAAMLALALPLVGVAAAPSLVRRHPRAQGATPEQIRDATAAYLYLEGAQNLLRETGGATLGALALWYLFGDAQLSRLGQGLFAAVIAASVGCVAWSFRGRSSALEGAARDALPELPEGAASKTSTIGLYAAIVGAGIVTGVLAAFATDLLAWLRSILAD